MGLDTQSKELPPSRPLLLRPSRFANAPLRQLPPADEGEVKNLQNFFLFPPLGKSLRFSLTRESSVEADQCVFSCHWRVKILALPWEQTTLGRPCGRESATIFMQAWTQVKGTYFYIFKPGNLSLSDRPSLRFFFY